MKTNRNKFLHIWEQQLAIVVPHLHFDVFLHRICRNVSPLTVICVWDGEKPKISNILYVPGGGSFAKSSNIGIAFAQSLGFSYVLLINDDVEIFLDQIIQLLKNIEDKTDSDNGSDEINVELNESLLEDGVSLKTEEAISDEIKEEHSS